MAANPIANIRANYAPVSGELDQMACEQMLHVGVPRVRCTRRFLETSLQHPNIGAADSTGRQGTGDGNDEDELGNIKYGGLAF